MLMLLLCPQEVWARRRVFGDRGDRPGYPAAEGIAPGVPCLRWVRCRPSRRLLG